MQRYGGMEGLRAWLAWTVVFSHVTAFTGFGRSAPWLQATLGHVADTAIMVFTIMSGFVITHLIVERREPYLQYITRRLMRIYPVYIVALAAGMAGTYLAFDTFLAHPWGAMSPPTTRMALQAASLANGDFGWHLMAHLSMLHGAISSRVLYESQYMCLGPAWSLSLEWQFYLVAPWVVAMARHRIGQIVLAALACAGYWLYAHGTLGLFMLPSILPGAVLYFAAGIVTRLLLKPTASVKAFPLALLVLVFGFLNLPTIRPILVWAAFLCFMLLDAQASDVVSRGARRLFDLAFDSRPARWLGEVSYSTYLIHMPIVQLTTWVCVKQAHLGPVPTFVAVLLATVPGTLLASAVLHRFVEKPGIAWGRRWPAQAGLGRHHPPVANPRA
jgi:peptidoglycan/LPS O-acetylase OafA/YrhL